MSTHAEASRPRVIYLDHCAQLSGAEIALWRLLSHIGEVADPHVVLAEDGPLVERLRSIRTPVSVAPVAEVGDVRKDDVRPGAMGVRVAWAWGSYVARLARLLRRQRPDVIHTNSLKAAVYGGLVGRLIGVPVVWHLRDSWTPDYLPNAALRILRLAAAMLPTTAVANSQATLDSFVSLVGRRTTARLRPQVLLNVLPATSFEAPKVNYGTVTQVLMVGRIAPWKGQDVFLRAFARLARMHPDVRAHVAGSAMFGEADYEDSLRDLVQELGIADRVFFRGFVEDVSSLLRDVDVLVHASVTPEPFGQVIVEGMAAGLPVIAADLGGPREIITHGVDGYLTTPGDERALASALAALVSDPKTAETIGHRARDSAMRYEPMATVATLAGLYQELATRKKSRPRLGGRFVRQATSGRKR